MSAYFSCCISRLFLCYSCTILVFVLKQFVLLDTFHFDGFVMLVIAHNALALLGSSILPQLFIFTFFSYIFYYFLN